MEYAIEFVIGGAVMAGSKVAAKYMGPTLAPIIGGMPTGIIASIFLSSNKDKIDFFSGYVYSSFLLFITIVGIHILSLKYSNYNINYISLGGLVLWGIASYFVIKMNMKNGTK